MKRGIFFTLDSVYALLIVVTIISVFTLVTIETVSAELIHEGMRFASEDGINVLYYANVWDIRDQPEVRSIYLANLINSSDMNASVIEMFGALWATNTPANQELISNITKNIFGNRTGTGMFGDYEWQVRIDGDPVFGTAAHGSNFMTSVSRRQVSGYSKGQPHVGYTAKAYLSNIFGKQDSKYVFFGGFVGQGNITAYLRGVPPDARVQKLYFEANLGTNVSLFVNGTFCGEFKSTNERYRADAWTLVADSPQNASCLGNITLGGDTRIDLKFNDTNITGNFIGGGYIRADYVTDTISYDERGHLRYYFPGINGIVNLYDSFYVPGNITNMSASIGLNTSYTTFLEVGNHTVFEINGTDSRIILDDRNFSGPGGENYPRWSNVTVPIRIGSPNMSVSGTTVPVDVFLVTDVSGSMEWCPDQSEAVCGNPPCTTVDQTCSEPIPPGTEWCGTQNEFWYAPNGDLLCGPKQISSCGGTDPPSRKIDIAMAAERTFVNTVLGYEENRVGIVDYSSYSTVERISFDLRALNLTIWPNESLSGIPQHYVVNYSFDNNGTSPITEGFNASLIYYNFAGQNGIIDLSRFEGLGVGQSVNRSFEFDLAPSTWFRVYLFLDTVATFFQYDVFSEISETNESNNALMIVESVSSSKPDLVFWRGGGELSSPVVCGNDIRNIPPYPSTYSFRGREGNDYNFATTWFHVVNNGTQTIPAGTVVNISVWNSTHMLNSTARNLSSDFNPHDIRDNSSAQFLCGDWYCGYAAACGGGLCVTGHPWQSFLEIGELYFTLKSVEFTQGVPAHYLFDINYRVDTPNVVDESDELNNIIPKQVWDGATDIAIHEFVLNQTEVCGPGLYDFIANVELEIDHNNGHHCVPAGYWNVSIYGQPLDYSNPYGTMHWTNTTTFMDRSATGWGVYYYDSPDVYTNMFLSRVQINAPETYILAWADHPPNGPTWNASPENFNGIIPEFREYNNNASARVRVRQADLRITNWLAKPLPGCNGTVQDLEMPLTIINEGGCPVTQAFGVGVYNGSIRVGHVTFDPATLPDGRLDVLEQVTVTVVLPQYRFELDEDYWACVDDEPQYLGHAQSSMCVDINTGVIAEAVEGNVRWILEWLDPFSGNERSVGSGWVHVAFPNLNVSGTVGGFFDNGTAFVNNTGLVITPASGLLLTPNLTFQVCNPELPRDLIINASIFNDVISNHTYLSGGPFGDAHMTGCPIVVPFEFRLYEGTDVTLGSQIYSAVINPMAGYASLRLPSIPWNAQTFGSTRWLHAVVDANNVVAECNAYRYGTPCAPFEGVSAPGQANVRSIKIEGIRSDVAVGNVQLTSELSPGDTGPGEHMFTVRADVTNRYCGTINPFDVAIYETTSGVCGTGTFRNSTTIGPLNPGQTVQVELKFSATVPSVLFTVSFLADSSNAIPEGNEGNNCLTASMVIVSGAGTSGPGKIMLSGKNPIAFAGDVPEIGVRELSVDPEIASCGSINNFRLRALVENKGAGSGDFEVVFRRDSPGGEEIGRARVAGLSKGQTTIAEARWTSKIEKDVKVFAVVGNVFASTTIIDPPCEGSDVQIFGGGMVRSSNLTGNQTELNNFIDASDTWFGTCICCGIMRATERIAAESPAGGSVLRAMVVMSDGHANVGCALGGATAADDAVIAACNAYADENITVYAVGFGNNVNETTLRNISICGHGQYFSSVDPADLEVIYRRIAEDLLNITYHGQAVETSGPKNATLSADSYIDIYYENSTLPAFGYGQVPITFETPRFTGCEGSFDIPSWQTVFDIRATSYSSEFWTDNVSLMRTSDPPGDWAPAYRLGWYGQDYRLLGDPFHIQFDPSFINNPQSADKSFAIGIRTGSAPDNESGLCSQNNSVIYKALVPAWVPFGEVLPIITGNSNVTVWYDLNGDGIPDGNITTGIGTGLDIYVDGNATDVSKLDNETNALHNAFMRLLERLNFRNVENTADPDCSLLTNPLWTPELSRSGTKCNPIDIPIPSDIVFRASSINKIPYMWGPSDVEVVVWIR